MQILIVSQYYLPESALIAPSIATELAARGHSVRVLTGFPNYPEGRIYPGYRQTWRRKERIDGIDVCRVPLFIDHSQSALRRILNYVSFGLSAATARGFARGADVIYVYGTQMTPALGPWIWRALGGAPYVVHVQDLWPDSIVGSSIVGGGSAVRLMERTLNRWLRSVYRRAAAVVAIAPGMKRALEQRGAPAGRVHQVYNWAAVPETLDRAPREAGGPVTVLYAGNVGDMQNLGVAVEAAHLVGPERVTLRIIGSGVDLANVQARARELGADNVEILGRVPREEMPAHYAEADYSLISLKDLPVFAMTIPSKLQASVANGVPVISTVAGDLQELVDAHRVGFTARPEDVESLASAFVRASEISEEERAALAVRARELYDAEFSFSAALDRLETVLTSAAQERKRSR